MSARLSILIVFTCLVAVSCKKDDFAYNSEFKLSQQTWLSFKSASANSYRYTVTTSSWTGLSTETTITVEQGRVTHRSFVKTYRDNFNTPITEQWQEDEAALNSHDEGAATITMDEIYENAKTDWLLERENATTYFEAKNDGIISLCGYVTDGCADDCFIGISISSVRL